jgi:hypothetical protein
VDPTDPFRKLALGHPEAVEGGSCVKAAFSARKRNFLFLGLKDHGWIDESFRLLVPKKLVALLPAE